jgi:hypothetical protein
MQLPDRSVATVRRRCPDLNDARLVDRAKPTYWNARPSLSRFSHRLDDDPLPAREQRPERRCLRLLFGIRHEGEHGFRFGQLRSTGFVGDPGLVEARVVGDDLQDRIYLVGLVRAFRERTRCAASSTSPTMCCDTVSSASSAWSATAGEGGGGDDRRYPEVPHLTHARMLPHAELTPCRRALHSPRCFRGRSYGRKMASDKEKRRVRRRGARNGT